jgi:ribose transport system substrate-binding protein
MVNTLSPIQGVKVTAFVGFDNQESASVAAYSALNALGGPGVLPTGKIIPTKKSDRLNLAWWQNVYKTVDKSSIKGNVAIINGVAGDFFAVNRGIGFHSVIDQYPGIKVVATKYADWTRAEAETDAENILQNNPSLNLIWCASSEMECGAITAVTNAGRENQVKVVGNDGTPETVGLITQGKLLAETWHGFPEWGWYGAEITVELALGETVQQKYDIDPRVEYKGNADQFYPNPNLLPINWKTIIANAKT